LTTTENGFARQAVSDDRGTVALSSSSPTFIDGEGKIDFYTVHQFDVPEAADYVNGDITWNSQSKATAVFETLFDPAGRVAAYNRLGTAHSGRGHVEITNPSAGTWTAIIFTVNDSFVYSGDVQFSFNTRKFVKTGSVEPSKKTLNPGQSQTFSVNVNEINQPGDHISTLRLTTGGTNDGSIPIAVRTLVNVNTTGATFNGTLTGGQTTGQAGQHVAYQFDVPAGK